MLDELVDLERDERRRRDRREVLPPTLGQPQAHRLGPLHRAHGQQEQAHPEDGVRGDLREAVGEARQPRPLDIPSDVGHRGGEVGNGLAERLDDSGHPAAPQQEDDPTDQPRGPLDSAQEGEQAQDDELAQCPPAHRRGRLVSGSLPSGVTGEVRAAAQAPPGFARRGRSTQPGGQVLLDRAIGDVAPQGAGERGPVDHGSIMACPSRSPATPAAGRSATSTG